MGELEVARMDLPAERRVNVIGKVDFMQINPMIFTEFLMAVGNDNLLQYFESVKIIDPIPDI